MALASTLSLCVFSCCIYAVSTSSSSSSNTHGNSTVHGIEIAAVLFENVRQPMIYTIVLVVAAVSKVAFHHAHFLSSRIPESCLLIILGQIFGAILEFSGGAAYIPDFFSPHDFFQFILPPIILEAAYSLHDRTFADNIGSVLLFAVVGTILAFFALGFTLYGLAISGAMGAFTFQITLTQILIFAALIVAVDPVAVLAVFQEIGVNNLLYYLVFGESLLNDGVTVVLYQVMQTYNKLSSSGQAVDGDQIGLGILKFFVVCFGGLGFGVLAGILTALLTRCTRKVKIAQPLIVYTMVYLGFLLAELFEFSGIISIIGCGLVQVHYAFHNISEKSKTTIIYFTKVISTTNEIIIFLFLGLVMFRNDERMWHTGFVLWAVFFCFIYRFIITFVLSFLINKLDDDRTRDITYDEQFVIAYGGLRGAVAFSLVALLDEKSLPPGMKDMFVTATLTVIFFTVFVQGITIKPLVKLFRVRLAHKKELSMFQDLNENLIDHLMGGVEEIIGVRGRYAIKGELDRFEDRYIRKFLQINPELGQTHFKELHNKILLKEHYKNLQQGGASVAPAQDNIPEIETSVNIGQEENGTNTAPGAAAGNRVTKDIDASGLSDLLKMNKGATTNRKWDRNLTEDDDAFANQMQIITDDNRSNVALQRTPRIQRAAPANHVQEHANPVFENDRSVNVKL
ncbi:sodium/hydrogen exchanger 1-like [Haliotis asinina]|uniref:sodium/hydrogen exchanger 1-like n=1 Tax=Haliotis asinina TaxID=109174 RepID=UPI0035323501